jgi:hypothetical protein
VKKGAGWRLKTTGPRPNRARVDVGRRCRVRLATDDVDRGGDYATASTPLRGCGGQETLDLGDD